ncbi:MAG: rRNA maturation RNase YbeY [Verrucomicrobia bacterium]|nr:rRNA maturation RNase YbeY [Verrucomicrobiota bacterium]
MRNAQSPARRWVLVVRNRQRTRRVNTKLLRELADWVLEGPLRASEVELCVHLVGEAEISALNWDFLEHAGSTDVITFDQREEPQSATGARAEAAPVFHGEIFISVDDAVAQAKRFRTTWQSELARYVIHGLLHLAGHDDLQPTARQRMKRQENRLLKLATAEFPLRCLAICNLQSAI